MSTQTVPVISGTVTVDPAKIAEFQASTPTLVKQAWEFTIEDQGDYEFSLTIAEEAIKRQKTISEFFAPTKKLANQLHKSITQMENDLLAPYEQVERLIKDRRFNWRQEQERLRLKKEAEDRRIAQEAEQERLLEEAAQLEKEGEKEAAEVVLEQAENVPAPSIVVQSFVPRQSGSSIRKKFSYRIDDETKIPREFCSPDPKKLRAHVDAYGMQANIAGITVYPDENEAIRTKGR